MTNIAHLYPSKELESFFDFIYKDSKGYAYSPVKKQSGEWVQHFFQWPDDKDRLVNHVITNTRDYDVYYSPALFSSPNSKKEFIQETNHIWVEFDGTLPSTDTLDGLPKPSLRLCSSFSNNQHWLWTLDVPESDVSKIERVNRALAYKLQADKSGWDANQVLRPVGTINHKCDKPVVLLSQSDSRFGINLFDSIPIPPQLVREDIGLEELPDPIQVLALYPWSLDELKFFRTKEQPIGSRSSALTRLGYICCEKYMTDEEAFAMLIHADERWGKFTKRSDRVKRLLELLNYTRQKYPLEQTGTVELPTTYPIFSFKQFIETDIHVEWYIPGVLQKSGLLFLTGPPGLGKTTLTLQFAVQMALGKNFLGWELDRPVKLLFLSLEMGHADLKYFVEQLYPELSKEELDQLDKNLHIVPLGYPLQLNTPQEQKRLRELLESYKPDGLIIDSLAASTDEEISSEKTVKGIINPLSKMRINHEMFVWFIHHNRKAQSDNKKPKTLSDVFGSQYIIAQATTVIGLWPLADDLEMNALKIRLAPKFAKKILTRQTESLGFKLMDKEDQLRFIANAEKQIKGTENFNALSTESDDQTS